MPSPRPCWCGNTDLQPFTADYSRCAVCETLVLADDVLLAAGRVNDNGSDFYGRDYWFEGMRELGFADLVERARQDLGERCIHWLKTVLRYREPPGRTLELGCAHGGFVAMLRAVGFDAQGLELSPSIADFAKRTFGVSVLVGPIEDHGIEPGSLDAVLAMDVVEHLPNPLGTIEFCGRLLAPQGVFVLQTPCYPEGATAASLNASAFEQQLSPKKGHIYLFSRRSIQALLARVGFPHVTFEPAIFAHYDMFLVAGRTAFSQRREESAIQNLLDRGTFDARLVLALMDADRERMNANVAGLRAEIDGLRSALNVCEADRAARLEVIVNQGSELSRLRSEQGSTEARMDLLKTEMLEGQRLRHELTSLRGALDACEADREARLEVIRRQGDQLGQIGKLRANTEFLTNRVLAGDQELERLRGEVTTLRAALDASEACGERLRGEVTTLRAALDASEACGERLRGEVTSVRTALDASATNGRMHLQAIERQDAELLRLSSLLDDLGSLKVRLEAAHAGQGIFERLVGRVRRAASDDSER